MILQNSFPNCVRNTLIMGFLNTRIRELALLRNTERKTEIQGTSAIVRISIMKTTPEENTLRTKSRSLIQYISVTELSYAKSRENA